MPNNICTRERNETLICSKHKSVRGQMFQSCDITLNLNSIKFETRIKDKISRQTQTGIPGSYQQQEETQLGGSQK